LKEFSKINCYIL